MAINFPARNTLLFAGCVLLLELSTISCQLTIPGSESSTTDKPVEQVAQTEPPATERPTVNSAPAVVDP